jgi:hypothetical protein
MRSEDHSEALRLMEKAVLALQGSYHPGRPAFYALGRAHDEICRARREVSAQSPGANACEV